MLGVGRRLQLGIESIRAKVEKRSLQIMGHAVRLPNSRLSKKVYIDWHKREGGRTGKQTTIHFGRKLVREEGLDKDYAEMSARNRKK